MNLPSYQPSFCNKCSARNLSWSGRTIRWKWRAWGRKQVTPTCLKLELLTAFECHFVMSSGRGGPLIMYGWQHGGGDHFGDSRRIKFSVTKSVDTSVSMWHSIPGGAIIFNWKKKKKETVSKGHLVRSMCLKAHPHGVPSPKSQVVLSKSQHGGQVPIFEPHETIKILLNIIEVGSMISLCKTFVGLGLRVGFKGWFKWGLKSQVPLVLASPDVEVKSQLSSLKKSFKYA